MVLVAVILITTGGPYSGPADEFTGYAAIHFPVPEEIESATAAEKLDALYYGPARILMLLITISITVVFATTIPVAGQRNGILLFAGMIALSALIVSLDTTIPTRLAGLAFINGPPAAQFAPLPGMFPTIKFGLGAIPISILSLLVLIPFYLLNKSLEASKISDADSEAPPASLYIMWQRRLGPFIVITMSTLFAYLVYVLSPYLDLGLDPFKPILFASAIARLFLVGLISFSLPLLVLVRHDQRTRERMSSEIRESIIQAAHDKVSNRLSALALRAEAAFQSREESVAVLSTMPDALRQAVADLKVAVGGAPSAKGQISVDEMSSRISAICARATREFGSDISCGVALNQQLVFDGQTAEILFQCLDEALANVARHAEATSVKVSVFCDASLCHLVIDDNGIGFPVPDDIEALTEDGHLGLAGISKRSKMLKEGRLTIDSTPGSGARIDVSWQL